MMSEINTKILYGWHREIDSHKNVRYVSMSGQVFYNNESIVEYMALPTNCKCWQSGIITFKNSFDFNPDSTPEMSSNGTPQKRSYKCKEWLTKFTPKQYEDLVRQMLLYFAVYSSAELEEIYYIVKHIQKETKDDNQTKEERTKINAWFREFDYDDFIAVNGSLWKTPLNEEQIAHALYELYQAKHLPFDFDGFTRNRNANYSPVIVSGPILSDAIPQIQYSPVDIIKSPPRLSSIQQPATPQQSPQHQQQQLQLPVEQAINYEPAKIPITACSVDNNRPSTDGTIDTINNNNDSSAKANSTMLNKRVTKPRNNRKQSPVKTNLPVINEPHVMSPTRPFYYNYSTNNFIFPLASPIHNKSIPTSVGLQSVPGGNQPVIIVNNTVNNTFSHGPNHTITFDTINNTNKTLSPTKMARTTSIMQPNTPIPTFSLLTSKHEQQPPTCNSGLSTIVINPLSVTNHSMADNKHPINIIPLSVVQNIPPDRMTSIPQTTIIPEMMPKPKRTPKSRAKRTREDLNVEPLNNGTDSLPHPIPNQKPVQIGFPNSNGKMVPIFNGVFITDNHTNGSSAKPEIDHDIIEPGFESIDSTPYFKISKFTILNESEK